MDKTERIKELVELLNYAGRVYYQEANEIMSNLEYDALYDELVQLENETGMVLASSPTVNVGYEVVSDLPKETHESPMLSLDKTKEVEGLKAFLGNKEGVLSWKMDGLTVVLTYENGELSKAVTRGNGEVGEVITANARTFKNLPLKIAYKEKLVLRGEAIIKYSDFEKINSRIEDVDAKYKNPRNLCSGSVRQLNSQVTSERNVQFYAFSLVQAGETDFRNSIACQYEFLAEQGFQVVEYKKVTRETVEEAVAWFAENVHKVDTPSDGLVMMYDDIAYGISLGRTAKFPRNGIAFKWADELAETVLTEIEWSPSRTGLINPVAIFEPVELEGTTVSRASVHNLSIMEALALGIGDTIKVYKANMIIPQIGENLTRSGNCRAPETCPACGGKTVIHQQNEVKVLFCENENCPAKKIKAFTHFVSRDAMNIDGLSEETLEKFIDKGWIHEFADIYHLDVHEDAIVNEKGFGRKSYDKLMAAVNASRNTTLVRVIYSLGIANIGLSNAKMLCKYFSYNLEDILKAEKEELTGIEGVGDVIAESVVQFFAEESNREMLCRLLEEVELQQEETSGEEQIFEGMVFVVTGSVEHFANRNELKAKVESLGGKVTGSVTSKTNYLINNDALSNSSKNKKARELGVQVITEEEFLAMLS